MKQCQKHFLHWKRTYEAENPKDIFFDVKKHLLDCKEIYEYNEKSKDLIFGEDWQCNGRIPIDYKCYDFHDLS